MFQPMSLGDNMKTLNFDNLVEPEQSPPNQDRFICVWRNEYGTWSYTFMRDGNDWFVPTVDGAFTDKVEYLPWERYSDYFFIV